MVLDGHRLVADVLCTALLQLPEVAECAIERTADKGFAQFDLEDFDVVVLDAELTGPSSVETAAEIRGRWPEVRIVMLSGRAELDLLADAATLGVDAFCTKDLAFEGVAAAVVAQEPADLAESQLLAMVADGIRQREADRRAAPVVNLTPRERELLGLLSQGVSTTEMATLLGLQLETCRGYLKSLLMKLGARSQLQAVVYAARAGLLDEDDPLTTAH